MRVALLAVVAGFAGLLSACSGGTSRAAEPDVATIATPGSPVDAVALPDPAQELPPLPTTAPEPVAVVRAGPGLVDQPSLAPPTVAWTDPAGELDDADARAPIEGWASGRVLEAGAEGLDVLWVQRRLAEMRFSPGAGDGVLGESTVAALWALQKIAGLEPRDQVDAEVWSLLQSGVHIPALVAGEPDRAEIDLDRQLMTVWRDGAVVLVSHVSTGSGERYCSGGRCRNAVTPTGDYHVRRRIHGWRRAPLGRLYNPLYFNGGIAIHGSGFVPTWPDSHGCVRVPMHVAEDVPALLDDGAAVHVLRSTEL